MKRVVAGLLAILLCGAVYADEPASPEKHDPAPAAAQQQQQQQPQQKQDDELPPLNLAFRPRTVQGDFFLRYDDDGQQDHPPHRRFSMYVATTYNPELWPIGCRDVKLTRIVSDSGRELSTAIPKNFSTNFAMHDYEQPKFFDFLIPLPWPGNDVRGYREISGSMVLQIGASPFKHSVMPPIKEMTGHRVRIEGLGRDDAWMNVTYETPAVAGTDTPVVALQMPTVLHPQLADVQSIAANNTRKSLEFHGTGTDGSKPLLTEYRYLLKGDETTRLVLVFYSRVIEKPVQFTMRDVTLYMSAKTADKPEPRVTAAQPDAKPPAAAPAGDLKVTPEQTQP